jgi:hypothetical protein
MERMCEVPWGITVLPGLEGGAPVSPGREAKAEALAVLGHMGMPCGVCDPH